MPIDDSFLLLFVAGTLIPLAVNAQPTVGWTAVPDAVQYQLVATTLPYRAVSVSTIPACQEPVCTAHVAVAPGVNYQWQVRAILPTGESLWSNTLVVEYPGVGNRPLNLPELNIQLSSTWVNNRQLSCDHEDLAIRNLGWSYWVEHYRNGGWEYWTDGTMGLSCLSPTIPDGEGSIRWRLTYADVYESDWMYMP